MQVSGHVLICLLVKALSWFLFFPPKDLIWQSTLRASKSNIPLNYRVHREDISGCHLLYYAMFMNYFVAIHLFNFNYVFNCFYSSDINVYKHWERDKLISVENILVKWYNVRHVGFFFFPILINLDIDRFN